MEIEHLRNRGITAGTTAGKPQKHQAVQSAVPDADGLELGNEVKAEMHDVRRDRTKMNQSATADPAGLDADFLNAARDTGVSESSGCGTADMYDGPKLRNEVEAEAQSADRVGTVEIERRRYAAGQAAGRQGSTH